MKRFRCFYPKYHRREIVVCGGIEGTAIISGNIFALMTEGENDGNIKIFK